MRHVALEFIFKKSKRKRSPRSSYHHRSLSHNNIQTNIDNSNDNNNKRKTKFNFSDNETLLISFKNQKIRDKVYEIICSQKYVNIKKEHNLKYIQTEWCKGNMSNFDYLMYLNQRSGRSFNDLTQYPIFPWIITDYTSKTIDLKDPNIYRDLSKPVGALNPVRLKKIQKRYNEMPNDNKFMYGSHYSTPGYVMYFLVRQCPELMLRFQNGKFDAPDRLFSSILRYIQYYLSISIHIYCVTYVYIHKYLNILLDVGKVHMNH